MTPARLLLGLAAAATLLTVPARADNVRPIQVQVREREPGLFEVQWRVQQVIPFQAMPSPVLPDHCKRLGELVVLDQSGSWLNRQSYRCSESLPGYSIGIEFPFPNPSISTVIRIELLSGDRFAHALNPSETSWEIPATSGGTLQALILAARRSVLAGAQHVVFDWVHLAFLVSICLLGGLLGSLRLATAFAVGQLASVLVTALVGPVFSAQIAELCVAIAVLFLAREAMRTERQDLRLTSLVAAAGLFHGLSAATLAAVTSAGEAVWLHHVLVVLGMDAVLLALALGVNGLVRILAQRRPIKHHRTAVTYVVGGVAVAAALTQIVGGEGGSTIRQSAPSQLPVGMAADRGATASSRRVAPATNNAPIQSFVSVEPFEIRHEVLVRLVAVNDLLGLSLRPDGILNIDRQDDVAAQVAEFVAASTAIEIDGASAEGEINRADYVTVDLQGVLPRPTPVPESVNEAVVGVTLIYLTAGVPQTVGLSWSGDMAAIVGIPATVIDPETSGSVMLTAEQSRVEWRNQLMEDPIPTVTSIAVEPIEFPVPLVSLPLFAVAAALVVLGVRGKRRTASFVTARIVFAIALITGPLAEVAVALPARVGATPSEGQAKRILAGLLPNVYRAFEFREETAVYDRLALSVTGETLSDAYLEHRRALEMEERGGAKARVDAVEVIEVTDIESRREGGFNARAIWTVGGTVTHFGHRHFRQNRYNANVAVLAVDGTWKIRTIEVLEEERVR